MRIIHFFIIIIIIKWRWIYPQLAVKWRRILRLLVVALLLPLASGIADFESNRSSSKPHCFHHCKQNVFNQTPVFLFHFMWFELMLIYFHKHVHHVLLLQSCQCLEFLLDFCVWLIDLPTANKYHAFHTTIYTRRQNIGWQKGLDNTIFASRS